MFSKPLLSVACMMSVFRVQTKDLQVEKLKTTKKLVQLSSSWTW